MSSMIQSQSTASDSTNRALIPTLEKKLDDWTQSYIDQCNKLSTAVMKINSRAEDLTAQNQSSELPSDLKFKFSATAQYNGYINSEDVKQQKVLEQEVKKQILTARINFVTAQRVVAQA